jgi:16S rRNA pseudouridine516 synthase
MEISVRLDKYLSHMGFGTRNDVKKMIKNGWVTINDETIKKADYNVKEEDVVCVDDEPVTYVEYEYYMLNKPEGYVSATEDNLYPTVMELVQSRRHDLYPVGRLDVDTEGLLLLTNDGTFTHNLLSPKKHVDKKYYVEFDGVLPENATGIFSQPMEFEEFTSAPSKLEIIDENHAYLTIHEGKFHQVKRMFEKVNCTVTYLKRIQFGFLELGNLEIGEYRELTPQEVEQFNK